MEVQALDEGKMEDSRMTSAVAFVDGGIQDPCDDACSICLDAFSTSDPSTVTSCNHEFHLQCILEWCQRSSNCPMCWQPINLKDPDNQLLLDDVNHERSFTLTPSRNATTFQHPSFSDFELQHLPMGLNDPELEDRIIQHLAAAARMGRTHRISRREGSWSRSSAHTRPQFVVFSANPNESSVGPVSASQDPNETLQNNQISVSSSRSLDMPTSRQGIYHDNSYGSPSSSPNQESAGPSNFQPFSDNWKSKLSSMSMKYKDSISKSTRGWKEKLFSRSTSMAEIGSDVRREVSAGIATVSRMMERLETRDNDRSGPEPLSNTIDSSVTEQSNHDNRNTPNGAPSNINNSASFATNPISS